MSNVANYELRSRVLQLDDTERIYQTYKLYRRVEYCRLYNLPPPVEYHPEVHLLEFDYLQAFYPSEWSECEKIYKSDSARRRRLRSKIRWLIQNYDAYFIRLGFWDKILNKTSSQTRRRYVSRFLDSLNVPFVGNIDFGEDKGREHYHAVVGCRIPLSSMEFWYKTYGGFHSKKIRISEVASIRLSKYVSKLCNHAVKYTCKRGSLLYSRKCSFPKQESKKSCSPISAKGYFPGINYAHRNVNIRFVSKFRVPKSYVPVLFNRFCFMCGSLIVDYSSNVQNYVYTKPLANGKTKKLYFCSECIKKYNIKTGG